MDNSLHLNTLLTRFQAVRMKTIDLVKHLSVEDMVVQSDDFVSPIKWHLGHTTWFFENFILKNTPTNLKLLIKILIIYSILTIIVLVSLIQKQIEDYL